MQEVYENRVRFAETDQQGVVFYGEYVTYQDETFNAFVRSLGYDYDRMRREGWETHVVHVDLDYRDTAGFEDVIANAIRIDRIGGSSLTAAYEARRKADGATLAEGHVTHVAVRDGEPTRVPDDFRDAVVAFQEDPPEQG